MPSAVIRIDQPTHPAAPVGTPGRSRDDLVAGSLVQLRNADDTGVRSWLWSLVSKPQGSAAALANPASAVASFTPDLVGSYLVKLAINGGNARGLLQRRVAIVRDISGLRIPAAGEEDEANYLIGGVENEDGWWPDLQEFLEMIRTSAVTINSRHVVQANFDHGSTALAYVSFNSFTETTALATGPQIYWIAPRNGSLRRAIVQCQSAAGSTTLRMIPVTAIGSTLGATLATQTVNVALANTPYVFDFTGLGATFTQGQAFVFEWDPTTQPNFVIITFEFGLEG